ncbi:MAG: hypothetical protein JEZ03_06610 [Bacteroidales bacterium]|nr:hypothetical protein [Bacteroidales bacterium]
MIHKISQKRVLIFWSLILSISFCYAQQESTVGKQNSQSIHSTVKGHLSHTYHLNPGWNWLSFPVLDRQNDELINSINLLEQLTPSPESILFRHQKQLFLSKFIVWEGNLTHIQSSLGYKLFIGDTTESIINLSGSILDANHPITLNAGENWIGYNLPYSTNPLDALANVLDQLVMIRTQDWTLVKSNTVSRDTTIYSWIGNPKPLKFGDMLILYSKSNCTLYWNMKAERVLYNKITKPTQFNYTETEEYQSIFIEMNPDERIQEIGVFIDGKCSGAAVVENSKIQEVRVYIPMGKVGNVEFKTYTDTKATSGMRTDYSVIDSENRTVSYKPLKLNKREGVHFISFIRRKTEKVQDSKGNFTVTASLNSQTDQACFTIHLPEDGFISLDITNLKKDQIFTNDQLKLNGGTSTFKWDVPDELNKGIYIYKVIWKDKVITNQLTIK